MNGPPAGPVARTVGSRKPSLTKIAPAQNTPAKMWISRSTMSVACMVFLPRVGARAANGGDSSLYGTTAGPATQKQIPRGFVAENDNGGALRRRRGGRLRG